MNRIFRMEQGREPALSYVAESDFLELTGIARERLDELLQLEWLDCMESGACTLFSEGDVYRVRKLERICADFELSAVGGTIIVDLLERIALLEREVRRLRGCAAGD